jgi:hypothetical protein
MISLTRQRASSIIYDLVAEKKGSWIIPDNVCHAVFASIVAAGGEPLLTDVDASTLELNPNNIVDTVKSNANIKGVVMVRTYGNTSENYSKLIGEIKAINNEVIIVDDRCLAIPEISIEEDIADVYLYSTGYSKVVDLGYGGYAFSKKKIQSFDRKYNKHEEEQFDNFFKNAVYSDKHTNRVDIITASCSNWLDMAKIEKQKYFQEITSAKSTALDCKTKINSIYKEIKNEFQLGNKFNDWRFNIFVPNRDEVLDRLFQNNLFASKHYFPFSKLLNSNENKTWRSISPNIINLFNDFRYTPIMAEQTVELINKYAKPIKCLTK